MGDFPIVHYSQMFYFNRMLSPSMPPDPHSEFTLAWSKVGQDVFRYCSRQQFNGLPIPLEDAKDLTSTIAIKVCHGLPAWKREASLKTWVFAIARNVVLDYFRRKQIEISRLKELTRDADRRLQEHDRLAYEEKASLPPGELLKFLLDAVLRTKWPTTNKFYLEELDIQVLRTRVDHPEVSTKKLADYLGISPSAFDVRFCRAQIAIRVYCFLHRPELVGGIPHLRQRFNELISSVPPELNPTESAVFKDMVLEGDFTVRPNGWQDALRSACTKMIFSGK